MIATDIPAAENRPAKDGPACPVPMMMASKCCDTKHLLMVAGTLRVPWRLRHAERAYYNNESPEI